MAERLPALAIDVTTPCPDEPAVLFAPPVENLRMEIGFGGGEHLIDEATAHPATGFLGVEPFLNGMAKAVSAIEERGLGNIRLFTGDAAACSTGCPPARSPGSICSIPIPGRRSATGSAASSAART